MHVPAELVREVWKRLEARDRMAFDAALPESDKMATDVDRRLALLAYADRLGKLDSPSKQVLEFLQHNVGDVTADRLMEKYDNVTLKVCRLEQAMESGVYGSADDYPTALDCTVFEVWYGLCCKLGSLTPEKFDAFMRQIDLTATVFGPKGDRVRAFVRVCEPVLLEHVLFERIIEDAELDARENNLYFKPQTVQLFKERGSMTPERWAKYLQHAISNGSMDVVELIMAEGYRLDGTKVPAVVEPLEQGPGDIATQKPRKPATDYSEKCFSTLYVAAMVAALVYVCRLIFFDGSELDLLSYKIIM